jgi:hypothetical protein
MVEMYAYPTTTICDEFYAGLFECKGERREMIWMQAVTIFVATDRLGGQARRRPQIPARPSKNRPRLAACVRVYLGCAVHGSPSLSDRMRRQKPPPRFSPRVRHSSGPTA